jgi:hypothetical protein
MGVFVPAGSVFFCTGYFGRYPPVAGRAVRCKSSLACAHSGLSASIPNAVLRQLYRTGIIIHSLTPVPPGPPVE